MLRIYMIQTFRNILKKKNSFFINLSGLVIGITAFILIVLWINTELSFDSFQHDGDNIYRVDFKLYEEKNLELHSAAAVPAVGPELKRNFPEVLEYTRFTKAEGVVGYEDVSYKETRIFYAEPSFFTLFTFSLVKGTADKTILAVNNAVISKSAAKRYFGDADPIGKVITFNGKDKYAISAVANDAPKNSHLKFDILLSYQNLINQSDWFDTGWLGASAYTYVKLLPGTDVKALEKKMPALPEKFIGDFMKRAFFLVEFNLRELRDIHLYSDLKNELEANGNQRSVLFLGIIAVLVLLIAFVNYINLTTSRSLERAGEVGIRKALGAFRRQLVAQFTVESMVINFIALLISIVMVYLLRPVFDHGMGSNVVINFKLIIIIFTGILFTSILFTGVLPALYLSRFSAVTAMRGRSIGSSRYMSGLKNSMVVFQFTISIVLIAGTFIINRQLNFLKRQDLGIDLQQILVIEGPLAIKDSLYIGELASFKAEMLRNSAVGNITVSSCIPGKEITWNPVYGKLVNGTNTEKAIDMIGIDDKFLSTYGLKLIAGRNFDLPYQTKINQLIINKSAVNYLGLESPENAIGKELTSDQGNAKVIGVINDFNQRSLKEVPAPIAFSNRPWNQYYSLKVNTAQLDHFVPFMEEVWNKHFPDNPIHYFFSDDYFNEQYTSDQKFGKLFLVFSGLAIFIACLGLLGLSSYTITLRTKEIGVRKINGAEVSSVMIMLNRDFTRWVFLACLLAIPIAWFVMHRWLEGFAYKADLSWWIFALAGLLALIVAILTVSWQSWKAATRNPVEALRYE